MKRFIGVFLLLSILINIIGTNITYASGSFSDELLLQEFFDEVKLNKYYLMYEKDLLEKEPSIKNINKTEEGQVLFLLFDLENEESEETDNLIFMKELEINRTHVLAIDYMEDNIIIRNLTTNEAIAYSSFDCETWICSEYVEYGGGYSQSCRDVLGGACILLDKVPVWGKLVCYLGTIVLCQIPSGRFCVSGEWKPICAY